MVKNTDYKFAQDAQIVESHSQLLRENSRRRRMIGIISDSYKSEWVASPGASGGKPKRERTGIGLHTQTHPFTKKRRKLPGKRVWKNKSNDQFQQTKADMLVAEFNSKQAAIPAMNRLFESKYGNGNIKP